MEIIQQWQYNGAVHPEMLKDEAFITAKETGITAVESYVPWANIEPLHGKYDFSLYEPLVEKIEKHGLGWVPFLILGPYYAMPKWFLESTESIPARCLEHGRNCNIQSIWNPYLKVHVERFLKVFFERYGKSPSLRSVLLGISGNWGESIFPVSGGFYEEDHMHMGFWCGDPYAIFDFRKKMTEKYRDIDSLNAAWDTRYSAFDECNYPEMLETSAFKNSIHRMWYKFSAILPVHLKNQIKTIIAMFLRPKAGQINGPLRHWIDFQSWYRQSMTEWAEFWLSTARKYIKDTPIYIVTGGDGHPMQGADFFAQAKVAAKYNAGIRITSLSDSYADSFFLSNPVASACRFYGAYFETEEALFNSADAVAMRIFDASTSGARGIYFKNLIGYGTDLCTGKYFAPGKRTLCGKSFLSMRNVLSAETPIVENAVFYPDTAILIDSTNLAILNVWGSVLRKYMQFDFVNEQMLYDGALKNYKKLIILPFYIPAEIKNLINKWAKDGGELVRLNRPESGKGILKEGLPEGLFRGDVKGAVYFYNSRGKPVVAETSGSKITIPPHSTIRQPVLETVEKNFN